MALTASLAAGGIWQSASFMAFFGLGTFPFMFAAVLFGNLLNAALRNKILKIVPIFNLLVFRKYLLHLKKHFQRSLTEEVLHTKTKLDLTKLFYWGSFTTPICSRQR
jgi:sulfite exporter TauE/SafE